MAKISYLQCTKCGEQISADVPRTVCPRDGGALYVRYDLAPYIGKLKPAHLADKSGGMWRYADVLPDV
ncbi:MAG: threonine synthase, partial [Candidatus Acidiferrales bacterium]